MLRQRVKSGANAKRPGEVKSDQSAAMIGYFAIAKVDQRLGSGGD
jgi:hypothetical protein